MNILRNNDGVGVQASNPIRQLTVPGLGGLTPPRIPAIFIEVRAGVAQW
jgi:hypothetical protein